MVSEPPETIDAAGGHRKACDQCRARKIRCDKGPGPAPCSSCRAAQRECKTTGLGQKTKDVKHRVLISQQYERKIDQLEARLAGIEGLLQQLAGSTSGCGGALQTPSSGRGVSKIADGKGRLAPVNTRGVSDGEDNDKNDEDALEDATSFEGKSSMSAHAVFASDFLEHTVTSTPVGREAEPDMQNALAALRRMVDRQQTQQHQQQRQGQDSSDRRQQRTGRAFLYQKTVPKGGVCQLPMPPMDVVLKLLREIRVNPPVMFMMSCAFIDINDFIEACRNVYFATEDIGLPLFIMVNAGLYYLLQEKIAVGSEDTAKRAECDTLAAYELLCRANLETALVNLPLFLPPSPEMVKALLLGATYAIEDAKFSFAWQLNSAAAAMCQTLGWHHVGPNQQGDDDRTSLRKSSLQPAVFWFCYMLDKGLSLRFGRSCILHDWDISTPRTFHDDGANNKSKSTQGDQRDKDAWSGVMNVWIHTGTVLGQAYELLYSPAALTRPPEARFDAARQLVTRSKKLWAEFLGLVATLGTRRRGGSDSQAGTRSKMKNDTNAWRAATLDRVLLSGEVGHLATLTLLYRAMPPAPRAEREGGSRNDRSSPSFLSTECVAAARAAFRGHAACMALAADDMVAQVGHVHWTVLYAPFTPLIVLFCHVIEVASRKPAREEEKMDEGEDDLGLLVAFADSLEPLRKLSPAIARMHSLCCLLNQIAELYMRVARARHEEERRERDEGEARRSEEAARGPEHEHPHQHNMQVDSDMQAVGDDLDRYLSQLGFLPQPNPGPIAGSGGPPAPYQQQQPQTESMLLDADDVFVGRIDTVTGADTDVSVLSSGRDTAHGAQATDDPVLAPPEAPLDDWFSGNTYVMGLIEDDFLDFGWDPTPPAST
ncbi:Transcription factor [Niveomyces insectorum RCEF 264]|uniref:Transcription factor n=1 Tax=Niveomyces insectorum RCEF 264 TaxID=1081102 RepID=A0A167Y108_9HYPO|nr:Transcription factor [Niveomyces insectorum RCEF 264]